MKADRVADAKDVYSIQTWTQEALADFDTILRPPAVSRGSLGHFERQREWFLQGPHGGLFAAALFDGVPVANCGIAGRRIIRGNRELAVMEIGESATQPDHQRRGLFSRVASACKEAAFANGAELVYGTPNAQATPGWRKLGFRIIEDPRSHLLVIPNPLFPTGGLASSACRLAEPETHKVVDFEIDRAEYIRQTIGFTRLNKSSAEYLAWRFGLRTRGYRFFRKGEIHCVMAPYQLGRFPMVAVAEYFRDGRRDPSLAIPLLGMAMKAWRVGAFAGIYMHGPARTGMGRFGAMDKLAIVHRSLPICVYGDPEPESDWFEFFQLSDCDIG